MEVSRGDRRGISESVAGGILVWKRFLSRAAPALGEREAVAFDQRGAELDNRGKLGGSGVAALVEQRLQRRKACCATTSSRRHDVVTKPYLVALDAQLQVGVGEV